MPRLTKNGDRPQTRGELEALAIGCEKAAWELVRQILLAVDESEERELLEQYIRSKRAANTYRQKARTIRSGRPSNVQTFGIIGSAMRTPFVTPRSVGRPRSAHDRDAWIYSEVERHRVMLVRGNKTKGTDKAAVQSLLREGARHLNKRESSLVNYWYDSFMAAYRRGKRAANSQN